jgi:broad specificity phosphatase PhoE
VNATRLLLCRHAEPRAQGPDPGLSGRGIGQARALAERLAAIPITAVYSSPARRAVATARPIAASHGLVPREVEALRELEFGELAGTSWEELEQRDPAFASSLLREPTRVRFPGGESYADLRGRVTAAADRLIARHAGEVVAGVTHSGPIRALLGTWLLMAEEAIFRLEPAHAGITVVDWFDGTPVVRAINIHSLAEVTR